MYSIRFDPRQGVLHLALTGFWSMATLASFAADLVARGSALRREGQRHGVLSDSRAFPVQAPDVAKGFERLMAEGTSSNIIPTAVIVASVLNKLQAERSLTGKRVRVFLDEADARAWLAAELAPIPSRAGSAP